MRGWPRGRWNSTKSAWLFRTARMSRNETGIAKANLDLQNFREAEARNAKSDAAFP